MEHHIRPIDYIKMSDKEKAFILASIDVWAKEQEKALEKAKK